MNSNGAILVTKIQLPSSTQVSNGTAYIYSGFSGGTESDIGFQYSDKYNVWKPYMKVGSKGQDQVQYLKEEANSRIRKASVPAAPYNLPSTKTLTAIPALHTGARTMPDTTAVSFQKSAKQMSAPSQNGKRSLQLQQQGHANLSNQTFQHLLQTSPSTTKQ